MVETIGGVIKIGTHSFNTTLKEFIVYFSIITIIIIIFYFIDKKNNKGDLK